LGLRDGRIIVKEAEDCLIQGKKKIACKQHREEIKGQMQAFRHTIPSIFSKAISERQG
jgi:hypothetical protein